MQVGFIDKLKNFKEYRMLGEFHKVQKIVAPLLWPLKLECDILGFIEAFWKDFYSPCEILSC